MQTRLDAPPLESLEPSQASIYEIYVCMYAPIYTDIKGVNSLTSDCIVLRMSLRGCHVGIRGICVTNLEWYYTSTTLRVYGSQSTCTVQ